MSCASRIDEKEKMKISCFCVNKHDVSISSSPFHCFPPAGRSNLQDDSSQCSSTMNDSLRTLFRDKNFRLLFFGNSLSGVGQGMTIIGTPWYIARHYPSSGAL